MVQGKRNPSTKINRRLLDRTHHADDEWKIEFRITVPQMLKPKRAQMMAQGLTLPLRTIVE
jgi:hypothetical protein